MSFAQATRILPVLAGLAKRQTSPCITTVQLSERSADFYGFANEDLGYNMGHAPPFTLKIVKAGPRVGRRWKNTEKYNKHICDVLWLDAMPTGGDDVSEFNEAVQVLGADRKGNLYKGKCAPLSEDAYNDLCREEEAKRVEENRELGEFFMNSGFFPLLPGCTDDDTDDDGCSYTDDE